MDRPEPAPISHARAHPASLARASRRAVRGRAGVLRRELERVTWHTLSRDVLTTPPAALLAAILDRDHYAALTGTTSSRLRYIGKRLRAGQIAATSFLATRRDQRGIPRCVRRLRAVPFLLRWGVTRWKSCSRIVLCYSVTVLAGPAGAWRAQPQRSAGCPRQRVCPRAASRR